MPLERNKTLSRLSLSPVYSGNEKKRVKEGIRVGEDGAACTAIDFFN